MDTRTTVASLGGRASPQGRREDNDDDGGGDGGDDDGGGDIDIKESRSHLISDGVTSIRWLRRSRWTWPPW